MGEGRAIRTDADDVPRFAILVPVLQHPIKNRTKRSALLTDILALSFSHSSLSILKLDKFKTGIILLSGLFLYDIWWVFGTEVVCNGFIHLGANSNGAI